MKKLHFSILYLSEPIYNCVFLIYREKNTMKKSIAYVNPT